MVYLEEACGGRVYTAVGVKYPLYDAADNSIINTGVHNI